LEINIRTRLKRGLIIFQLISIGFIPLIFSLILCFCKARKFCFKRVISYWVSLVRKSQIYCITNFWITIIIWFLVLHYDFIILAKILICFFKTNCIVFREFFLVFLIIRESFIPDVIKGCYFFVLFLAGAENKKKQPNKSFTNSLLPIVREIALVQRYLVFFETW